MRSVASRKKASGRLRSVHTQAAALPLVGNVAPDFKATAVFDQEFVDVTLSQYKVRVHDGRVDETTHVCLA